MPRARLIVLGAALAAALASCGNAPAPASSSVETETVAPPAPEGAPPPAATAAARPARPDRGSEGALTPPRIRRWLIPIGEQRKRDTIAYARRHYGGGGWRIERPLAIVQHVSMTGSVAATRDVFVPNVPDAELGERPGTCTQFVVARNGVIVQLTPVDFMCRHAVGLNWAAIGIEHVGFSDGEVLGNEAQMRASLRLTRWLRCRYGIPLRDVIGHAENVGSRYHRERVAALRTQTHGDFVPASMRRYRALLGQLPCGR